MNLIWLDLHSSVLPIKKTIFITTFLEIIHTTNLFSFDFFLKWGRLVSKVWRQFIDDDQFLANVQIEEVKLLYSQKEWITGHTLFHFACGQGSFCIVKLLLDNQKME